MNLPFPINFPKLIQSIFLAAACFCITSGAYQTLAQSDQYTADYFRSPVDFPIVLAGSFGELRTNHFHAGLDIKPATKTSIDSIRCVADGGISRIKIQAGGYGRAIYIDHENGYTSVYAHLKIFTDTLENFIRQVQKEAESYTVDIYPRDQDFLFKKGEVLGLMGNTGRSYAKHLHFEIRETESEIPVNPALWGIKPADNIPPEILSVDFHGLTPDYQLTTKKSFYTKNTRKGRYDLPTSTIRLPAWRCGIAVQTFDRMNGASNRNGVYRQLMYVDDTLYYGYSMQAVSFAETKFINSHIDFPTRKNENRTLVRCYKLPGNTLSIYDTIRNDGIIKLYKNVPRRVRLEISDIEGNVSKTEFSLYRDETMSSKSPPSFNVILLPERADTIKIGGMEAIVPVGGTDKKYFIHYAFDLDGDNHSIYTIADPTLLLFKSGRISIELPATIQDKSKAVIAYYDGEKWSSNGGEVRHNAIHGYWKYGGQYKVTLDTVAPVIQINSQRSNFSAGESIASTIWDSFGSALEYRVEIDGQWIIAPYKEMTRRLLIPLPMEINKGEHLLTITAWDDRGNFTKKSKTFKIL